MTLRDIVIKAMQILALAAVISAAIWVSDTDREVQQASLEQYCADAALWAAEESRGVPLAHRRGQPDYRGIAAEQCPGMRPAGPALRTEARERQLAKH